MFNCTAAGCRLPGCLGALLYGPPVCGEYLQLLLVALHVLPPAVVLGTAVLLQYSAVQYSTVKCLMKQFFLKFWLRIKRLFFPESLKVVLVLSPV